WRLGPVVSEPSPSAVGVGSIDEARELSSLVRAGRIAGAIVFAARPGGDVGAVPGRYRERGVARFTGKGSVVGEFTLLAGGEATASSSLGVHAAVDRGCLTIGADPLASWGALDL